MELVALVKEVFQNIAETAVSYRFGQSVLRSLDRTLWVVEKCARWAVPPPLDQDERPQPELVRPLPWVLFFAMLVVLRVGRETISLLNLVMGKPPLRSADVVMYIQSKRRYLRTLKYQGNRIMRARTSTVQPRESWMNALQSLFEFTMCFRRHSPHYGNNNTTRVSNNDEVLVVKRSKRGRDDPGASPTNETTMERLIEKMMVDLDAESDEDSSFTLTTVTSPKSDRSDLTIDSDQDVSFYNNLSNIPNESQSNDIDQHVDINEVPSSTPEKTNSSSEISSTTPEKSSSTSEKRSSTPEISSSTAEKSSSTPERISSTPERNKSTPEKANSTTEKSSSTPEKTSTTPEKTSPTPEKTCPTTEKTSAANNETQSTPPHNKVKERSKRSPESASKIPRTPNNEQKIANGRTVKSEPSKKKGTMQEKDSRTSAAHGGKSVSVNNSI